MSLSYISAEQLLQASVELALKVIESGYQPEVLIALWRGGTPVGVAMQEVFSYLDFPCEHAAISSRSYTAPGQQAEVRLSGLEQMATLLAGHSRVLLVDDVFDTGRTFQAVVKALHTIAGNGSLTVKLATPWFKPANNVTVLEPDYYLHTTSDWLVFPHELDGLTDAQLEHKPGFAGLLPRLRAHRRPR